MKKYLSALIVGVASVALVVPAAPANAAGCVSKSEYSHIHRGMPMSRVHRIFDTDGRLKLRIRKVSIRKYRPCPRHSRVLVSYRRGRVSAKLALWHIR